MTATPAPTQRALALMVPINNTTMEKELCAWLPEVGACTTLKIPRGKGLLTADTIPAYQQGAFELAQQLAGQALDVLAYGCTAASFLAGPASDRDMQQRLSDSLGLPVVTTAQSMVKELQRLGVQRVALVTPYHDEVNDKLKLFLADEGMEVRAFDTLRAPDVDALGRITADEVAAMARQVMTDDCEAMFIACSQLPTFSILDELSHQFQRPVLSSIQATAAQARQQFAPTSRSSS
jgi:maleate cis-trans isomerase